MLKILEKWIKNSLIQKHENLLLRTTILLKRELEHNRDQHKENKDCLNKLLAENKDSIKCYQGKVAYHKQMLEHYSSEIAVCLGKIQLLNELRTKLNE